MKVWVGSWVFLTCIVIVLTIADYSYAADRNRKKPCVRSTNFKGETENKFKTDESIYIKGRNFEPLTNVDIYVTKNKNWKKDDSLTGMDISSDGIETVQTTSKGNIPKTMVWGAPIVEGEYDIVVDANQDGTQDDTFNAGDAVDGKSANPGFKVRKFLP